MDAGTEGEGHVALLMPVVDSMVEKPYETPNMPLNVFHHVHTFHEKPHLWWIGQVGSAAPGKTCRLVDRHSGFQELRGESWLSGQTSQANVVRMFCMVHTLTSRLEFLSLRILVPYKDAVSKGTKTRMAADCW